MTHSCPLCRLERAYADTTPIKGVDEAIIPPLGCSDNTQLHSEPGDYDDDMPPVTGSS